MIEQLLIHKRNDQKLFELMTGLNEDLKDLKNCTMASLVGPHNEPEQEVAETKPAKKSPEENAPPEEREIFIMQIGNMGVLKKKPIAAKYKQFKELILKSSSLKQKKATAGSSSQSPKKLTMLDWLRSQKDRKEFLNPSPYQTFTYFTSAKNKNTMTTMVSNNQAEVDTKMAETQTRLARTMDSGKTEHRAATLSPMHITQNDLTMHTPKMCYPSKRPLNLKEKIINKVRR